VCSSDLPTVTRITMNPAYNHVVSQIDSWIGQTGAHATWDDPNQGVRSFINHAYPVAKNPDENALLTQMYKGKFPSVGSVTKLAKNSATVEYKATGK